MSDETIESLGEAGLLKDATEEDLEKVLNEDIRSCLDVGDSKVHHGDLTIDGSLDIDRGALIVIGNLLRDRLGRDRRDR